LPLHTEKNFGKKEEVKNKRDKKNEWMRDRNKNWEQEESINT
jgi:hypothetical protein